MTDDPSTTDASETDPSRTDASASTTDASATDPSTADPSTSHISSSGASGTAPPDALVAELRQRLLRFFDARARDLPWRRTEDPYAIWVSEVMLQQTRVATVVPYFERWMELYPDVSVLADAEQDEVLKSWEGLGYYRRARMLHLAARAVRDRHGGTVPDTAQELRTLPGIGAYTAGAVASIAFGRVEAAVDGNVRRVLARLFDLPEPTATELRDIAGCLVDPERPGDFNQALMELGATVCTPRAPDCGSCPVSDACRAHALGVEEGRPRPKERSETPERTFGVAVPLLRGPDDGPPRTLLVQRPPDGLLGGLWEFPTREMTESDDGASIDASTDGASIDVSTPPAVRALHGVPLGTTDAEPRPLPTVRHVYSHFRGVYRPVLVPATTTDGPPPDTDGDGRRVAVADFDEVDRYPLPVVQQRIHQLAREAVSKVT